MKNAHWTVRVSLGRDINTLHIETAVVNLPDNGTDTEGRSGYGERDPDTRSYSATRSHAETDALFDLVREKHGAATDPSAAVRYAQAFLSSVLAVPALANDSDHIAPFFTSVFRPASLQSRRSVSSSAFSLVFSKKRDDVDLFFDQAKAHIMAVYAVLKDIVKDLDAMAGVQIEYGTGIYAAETRLSEYAAEELDSIAIQLRKLGKFLHTLESITHAQSHYHIANTRQRLHSHTRSLKCMKVALDARLVALDEYEDACKVTQRRTQQLERVSGSVTGGAVGLMGAAAASSISIGRAADIGIQDLQQAKRIEFDAKERLVYATSTIKESYGKVRGTQGDDLQEILNDYVANQIKCHTEVLEAIEAWV
ncbi:hypothetical protein CcCBS67573_g06959 [Chytriomyces confervae]|uniref:Sorting nexin/Vps5-like C-terminal domain-containing protein n=1 Tax=Chytriomyces confervae TaxID=246404 RepID=A0A507EYI4_9FUNG|nr:hypothetical protein CcCBS67573_g06959 [Chytriomyces confervae]